MLTANKRGGGGLEEHYGVLGGSGKHNLPTPSPPLPAPTQAAINAKNATPYSLIPNS